MVQAGSGLGLLRETHHAIGIASNGIWQNLQSDPAIEPGVPRQIDLSHAAGAEEAVDLVATESCAGIQYRESMRATTDPIKRESVVLNAERPTRAASPTRPAIVRDSRLAAKPDLLRGNRRPPILAASRPLIGPRGVTSRRRRRAAPRRGATGRAGW